MVHGVVKIAEAQEQSYILDLGWCGPVLDAKILMGSM